MGVDQSLLDALPVNGIGIAGMLAFFWAALSRGWLFTARTVRDERELHAKARTELLAQMEAQRVVFVDRLAREQQLADERVAREQALTSEWRDAQKVSAEGLAVMGEQVGEMLEGLKGALKALDALPKVTST